MTKLLVVGVIAVGLLVMVSSSSHHGRVRRTAGSASTTRVSKTSGTKKPPWHISQRRRIPLATTHWNPSREAIKKTIRKAAPIEKTTTIQITEAVTTEPIPTFTIAQTTQDLAATTTGQPTILDYFMDDKTQCGSSLKNLSKSIDTAYVKAWRYVGDPRRAPLPKGCAMTFSAYPDGFKIKYKFVTYRPNYITDCDTTLSVYGRTETLQMRLIKTYMCTELISITDIYQYTDSEYLTFQLNNPTNSTKYDFSLLLTSYDVASHVPTTAANPTTVKPDLPTYYHLSLDNHTQCMEYMYVFHKPDDAAFVQAWHNLNRKIPETGGCPMTFGSYSHYGMKVRFVYTRPHYNHDCAVTLSFHSGVKATSTNLLARFGCTQLAKQTSKYFYTKEEYLFIVLDNPNLDSSFDFTLYVKSYDKNATVTTGPTMPTMPTIPPQPAPSPSDKFHYMNEDTQCRLTQFYSFDNMAYVKAWQPFSRKTRVTQDCAMSFVSSGSNGLKIKFETFDSNYISDCDVKLNIYAGSSVRYGTLLMSYNCGNMHQVTNAYHKAKDGFMTIELVNPNQSHRFDFTLYVTDYVVIPSFPSPPSHSGSSITAEVPGISVGVVSFFVISLASVLAVIRHRSRSRMRDEPLIQPERLTRQPVRRRPQQLFSRTTVSHIAPPPYSSTAGPSKPAAGAARPTAGAAKPAAGAARKAGPVVQQPPPKHPPPAYTQ